METLKQLHNHILRDKVKYSCKEWKDIEKNEVEINEITLKF